MLVDVEGRSTITSGASGSRRSRSVAVSPSARGIRMSISTTSGVCAATAAGTSSPSVASPTRTTPAAPGATPEEQATLALMWQATQGIFDALLLVGLVLLPTALICLGVAMFAAPAYGKGFGGLTVALGSVGIAAAGVALVTPTSPVAAVGVFALIAFHLAVGWRTYRA